ncbi:MAG TPA: diaminopimelate epimerase [Anaeromyxobacteraceae bacterium]|nr:diaminopimelate epimerase [Anaeromyxobacteraceae bacterium]
MSLPFFKYQALGNDFVVVELSEVMTAELARRLCHRRRGIGADGVLSVLPPRGPGAAYLHIYNSDGSVAAMCGNGIRCVARHLAERRGLSGDISIETDCGVKRCLVHRGGAGKVEAVSVEMGPARFDGEELFEVAGESLRGQRISMGNPHVVFFEEPSRERAARLGPLIERAVPGGVNVGFAALRDGVLGLVVHERGAGLTDACGTGACAAVAAAVKSGLLGAGRTVEVELPGGSLDIAVDADLSGVLMRGPAERSFQGVFEL